MSTRWRRIDGAEFARYGDEVVLIDREGFVYRGLSSSAKFIWERLEDEPTLKELAEYVSKRFALAPERAMADTQLFVARCRDAGLVIPSPDTDPTLV